MPNRSGRGSDPTLPHDGSPRNGASHDARGAAPSDTRIALIIIAGIALMFLVGFILLAISMASDWQ